MLRIKQPGAQNIAGCEMGVVYKLDFPNGKSYIGITIQSMRVRFGQHAMPSCKSLTGKAIRKYGKENVEISIIHQNDDWDMLCALEMAEIFTHNSMHPHGYNITAGGEGVLGHIHSEATRKKLSVATSRVMRDPKHRALVAENTRRSFDDPELRRMASVRCSKQIRTAESNAKRSAASTGRIMSEATREKISIAALARCAPKVVRECGVCHAEFKIKPSHARDVNYCSITCCNRSKMRRTLKTCSKCGIEIDVRVSNTRANNFCSRSCSTSFRNLEKYAAIRKSQASIAP